MHAQFDLDGFIESNRADMLAELVAIVTGTQASMRANPDLFTWPGEDSPSVDVRLCIDSRRDGSGTWIIRTGCSDYDLAHSEYCAASSIGLDTVPDALLDDLIQDLGG